jgi:fatty acid desaturase
MFDLASDVKRGKVSNRAVCATVHQCAFVGHDTAHNGITHNRNWDILIGNVVGPLATGISTAWWKHSHNAHHVVTNSVSHDPDIQHMPVFAVTENLFNKGGFWSFYHRRFFHFDHVSKFILSYQHLLYYPVMGFARFNLYAQSWMRLTNYESKIDYRYLEICAMLTWTLWFSAMVAQLPTAGMRIAFLLVSHMLAGILHVQITISHFSMPTYTGPNHAESQKMGENEAFLRQQVHTSMDLNSGWRNNWFYGGLQWQVVHHVFPRVPRHNLPIVRRWLMELCAKHGLHYKSIGWIEGNREIYRCLKRAAYQARTAKVVPWNESLIWAGLNAEG